jgi:hypothetical protein
MLVGEAEEKRVLRASDEEIILKCISKKYFARFWTGFD